jgi:hypothetical protein
MTLREAQTLVLRVLKQVMEEKLDQHNVQLAEVRNSLRRHVTVILFDLQLAGHHRQGIPHSGRTCTEGSYRYDVRYSATRSADRPVAGCINNSMHPAYFAKV